MLKSCTNVYPKCVSRSAKLISTDSACGCNRGGSRYSKYARYAPKTYRMNGQSEPISGSHTSCNVFPHHDVVHQRRNQMCIL